MLWEEKRRREEMNSNQNGIHCSVYWFGCGNGKYLDVPIPDWKVWRSSIFDSVFYLCGTIGIFRCDRRMAFGRGVNRTAWSILQGNGGAVGSKGKVPGRLIGLVPFWVHWELRLGIRLLSAGF